MQKFFADLFQKIRLFMNWECYKMVILMKTSATNML